VRIKPCKPSLRACRISGRLEIEPPIFALETFIAANCRELLGKHPFFPAYTSHGRR